MSIYNALCAVFYKETIKTRFMILLMVIGNILFLVWNFIGTRRLFMQDHSEVVWYRVVNLGQIPYADLMFIPAITALVFCCFQFLHETRDAKIRLSLHMPYDSCAMVLLHALFGSTILVALFFIDAALLFTGILFYFPYEVGVIALLTTLPWFIGGVFIYLGACFVLLEPQIKRKILGAGVFFGLCIPLYLYIVPAFYTAILGVFILCIPCAFLTISLSATDYRNRVSA